MIFSQVFQDCLDSLTHLIPEDLVQADLTQVEALAEDSQEVALVAVEASSLEL
jgi:hypothetical protein